MEKKTQQTAVKKIAIVGPESSGKTTLALDLKNEMQGAWVPEFARHYLHDEKEGYKLEDLMKIAEGQLDWEKNVEMQVEQNYIFCDTNLIVIIVWSAFVFDYIPESLKSAYQPDDYALHVLCKPDIPWEPDPLREHPQLRNEIFDLYEQMLKHFNVDYLVVSGSRKERLEKVKHKLERL